MGLVLKRVFCGPRKYRPHELKNKIRKRVLPVQIISGYVEMNENISINNNIVGKILSIEPHCFSITKIEEVNVFDQTIQLKQASIKIIKPYWLKN